MDTNTTCGVLLLCTVVVAPSCWAQGTSSILSAAPADSMMARAHHAPVAPRTPGSPWLCRRLDSATAWLSARERAFEAAAVDPGILWFVDPRERAHIHRIIPERDVDPEMILPDRSSSPSREDRE